MSESVIGIGIVIVFFSIIVFSFYRYVKKMKNKKVETPHCGGCDKRGSV